MRRTRIRWALVGLAAAAGGCGITQPPPLVPSQFVRGRPAIGPDEQGQPVGQSGALVYGELHSPLLPDEYSNLNPRPAPGISPQVQRDIPAPGQGVGATAAPPTVTEATTEATTLPAPGETAGYQVVGTVLAVVDTYPIFADKILASLERELAAEAHKFAPNRFRRAARQDIESKIEEEIHNRLEIERANAFLSPDSKTQAQLFAQAWRRQQITSAGGSETLARQHALEGGQSLDDLVHSQYEVALVQLYYQQSVAPRIHVTAADMRQYYAAHLSTEFSKHAEARFRLIKIDFARSGGPEQAATKANQIVADLKSGTPFKDEAKKYNDDPYLMERGGDEGWMKKGGFLYDKVEDAVWALQPGQFTDTPIQVEDPRGGSAFYIGYLEERRGGVVQDFDSPNVQRAIHDKLFSQQLAGLREKSLMDLVGKAEIFRDPNGLEVAVDMAMQRYPTWASAR